MRPAWVSLLRPSTSIQIPSRYLQAQSSARWLHRLSARNAQEEIHKRARIAPDTAAANDNRSVASSRELYASHPSSPGSPLFLPYGTHILLKLQAFLRAQYLHYGFQEVVSPIIYKKSLWETSGHWDNYQDDMFAVTGRGAHGKDNAEREIGEDEEYGLKPMNCPGHCLLFKSQNRSYRDLPLRFADFSPLHRNELSGALTGLTRLRRFHQDDGHIFCQPSQIEDEIRKTLSFVKMVYQTFDLGNYKLRLGTKPTRFVGDSQDWARAEARLKNALEESRQDYYIEEEGGAFYGPKIDIVLMDSNGKKHQTATIQLDFQLPARFDLTYDAPEKISIPQVGNQSTRTSGADPIQTQLQRPVLIHRAILGSLERFIALLAESCGGKWPFWMNPRQLVVLTVSNSEKTQRRVEELVQLLASPDSQEGARKIRAREFAVDCDLSDQPLGKKIVNVRKKGYCFYVVVGERDLEQPLDQHVLKLTLCSHPKPQEVHKILGDVAGSRPGIATANGEFTMGESQGAPIILTISQCQDLMTRLESGFL
ncbi:MAG: hypothetical protein Q9174_000509 [Haloplaca sp. 1 TL-2023]